MENQYLLLSPHCCFLLSSPPVFQAASSPDEVKRNPGILPPHIPDSTLLFKPGYLLVAGTYG